MLKLPWTTCGGMADASKGLFEVEDPPPEFAEHLHEINEWEKRIAERRPRMDLMEWVGIFLFLGFIIAVLWMGP